MENEKNSIVLIAFLIVSLSLTIAVQPIFAESQQKSLDKYFEPKNQVTSQNTNVCTNFDRNNDRNINGSEIKEGIGAFLFEGSITSTQVKSLIKIFLFDRQCSNQKITFKKNRSGPFIANGTDKVDVRIHIENESGDSLSGLSLQATLLRPEDIDREKKIKVKDLGKGNYLTEINSTIAGKNILKVRVEKINETETLPIEFKPGSPDHFWIANKQIPPIGSKNLSGSFELMLKDSQENLIPIEKADFKISGQGSNTTFEKSSDTNRDLIKVRAKLGENATPNLGVWEKANITVKETSTETSKNIKLEFPVVHFSKDSRKLNGDIVNSITLYSLNLNPVKSYELFIHFDKNQMQLVSVEDPNKTDSLKAPNVKRVSNGVRIKANGTSNTPTTELARLNFKPLKKAGLTQMPVSGSITFEKSQSSSLSSNTERLDSTLEQTGTGSETITTSTEFFIPIKILLPQEICMKVWRVEGVDKSKINKDIKEMKKVFTKSVKNCCPFIFFDIEHGKITKEEWQKVDDGDGKLSSPSSTVSSRGKKEGVESGEAAQLKNNHHKSNCINVYYVPGPIVSGGATLGGHAPGIEITDTGNKKRSYDTDGKRDGGNTFISGSIAAGDGRTLTHEMGHILGELKHPGKNRKFPVSNPMHQNAKDKSPGAFSKRQCGFIFNLNT